MKIISLLLLSALPLLADVQTNIVTSVMVTNVPIKISTTIVTNIVEWNNQSGCSTCEMLRESAESGVRPLIHHPPHSDAFPFKAATERWQSSNVCVRIVISMNYGGRDLNYTEDTPLSSVTNRWKLSTEWKKE